MTLDGLEKLTVTPSECGFTTSVAPDDSRCPVTPWKPDFMPSRILDEARSGWFPKGVRACVHCELCSPRAEASFASCADHLLLAGGKREGFFPRAFGGALDAVVGLQLLHGEAQKRLDWVTPELRIAQKAGDEGVGLFVGCAPYYDILLASETGFAATSETHAAVTLLNAIGVEPVVLPHEVCCGGDKLHAGDRDSFVALGSRNRDLFKEHGVRTIVTTCNDCLFTLGRRYPGRVDGWDFRVLSLSDFLVQNLSRLAFMPTRARIVIQPPDRYGDPDNVQSVRKLVSMIPGLDVKELESGYPSTLGNWNQFGGISKSMENALLKAAERAGGDLFLVQSTRPLVRLFEGRRPGSWEETSISIGGLYDFLAARHAVAPDFAGA